MPSCPKDVLQGRGRSQDVCPWQRVTTKIKYHPFSLAAGPWTCMVLSSSKQETTWPGKGGVLPWRQSVWALGRSSNVDLCTLSTPKPAQASRPELAEEDFKALPVSVRVSCSKRDLHFVLNLADLRSPAG